MRGVDKAARQQAVLETAQLLKIEPLLDRKPGQLSGGQRQRVAIGRALVRHPKVFLFDEPLSNLDAKLRMEMRTELKRLHQMLKTTVVYVTHDQIEAMTLATKVALMRDGRIEQFGTPDEIYNKPATRYVAEFVGAPPMNMIPARVAAGRAIVAGSDMAFPLAGGALAGLADGSEITIGIRPEAFKTGAAGAATVSVTAEIAELTGPEVLVTASLHGHRLIAALPPVTCVEPGAALALGFDAAGVHIFDADGRRIGG
jgi:multiple sugar transport system ATP-binding protein